MRQLTKGEILLKNFGISKPEEIDIEAIAYAKGATVKYKKLSGCAARIVGNNEQAIITISPSGYHERDRFSVAHEVGHWCLHRGRAFDCRAEDICNPSLKQSSRFEREADKFASDTLLPKYLFEPLINNMSEISYDSIKNIASAFRTSITSTALRVVDCASDPLILVCHGSNGRKWFRRSSDVPQRWFPSDEIGPNSDALSVLYGKQKVSKRGLISATEWFDRSEAGHYDIIEQSFQCIQGEVLTLLIFTDDRMLNE